MKNTSYFQRTGIALLRVSDFPVLCRRVIPLVVCLAAAGCGTSSVPPAQPNRKSAAPVQVARVQKRDLSNAVTYTGSVEPVRVARMASPAEGPVVECLVREGDRVQAGQRLARVGRSRIADTALAAAQEEFSRQKAEFGRVKQLVASGSLPGEQLDVARAGLKRAEAQVAAMETGKADYDIASPWPGIVSEVWIAEGDYVAPRAPLVEIFDPASLLVRFSVPERDLPSIQTGLKVQVTLDAYPGRVVPAEIVRVFPGLDPATRTVTVEAELREAVRLWRGLFARVTVPLRTVKNALVVPDSALLVLPDGAAVVFVAAGGQASRRKVRVALEAGEWLAIEDGIAEGEMIVVRGHESLKDGLPVQVMEPPARPGAGKPTAAPRDQSAPNAGRKAVALP